MRRRLGLTSFLLSTVQHTEDLEDVAFFAIGAECIPGPIEAEDELPTHVSNDFTKSTIGYGPTA